MGKVLFEVDVLIVYKKTFHQERPFLKDLYLNLVKEFVRVYVIRKFRQELSNVDKVSLLEESFLIQTEDAQGSLQ